MFHWYEKDFGNHEGIVRFVADYLEKEHQQEHLRLNASRVALGFADFDWSLNAFAGG